MNKKQAATLVTILAPLSAVAVWLLFGEETFAWLLELLQTAAQ